MSNSTCQYPTVLIVPYTLGNHSQTRHFGLCHCELCDFVFYVPVDWKSQRQRHQDSVFCPAGHTLRFPGELTDTALHVLSTDDA